MGNWNLYYVCMYLYVRMNYVIYDLPKRACLRLYVPFRVSISELPLYIIPSTHFVMKRTI